MARIGLIAGSGRFPLYFAEAAKMSGNEVIAIAVREETSPEIERIASQVHWFHVGEMQNMIDTFKEAGVNKMVMAGKITKALIFENIHPDKRLMELFKRVPNMTDTSLLGQISEEFVSEGIEVCDSTTFLSVLLPKKGILTERKPTEAEKQDIEYGYKIARIVADLDIGQTVVVKNRVTIAVEGIEGTDKAIMRGGELAHGDITVVKVARPKQDMRYDIPTVGVDTIHSLKNAGAKCLAFEAHRTLLLDREEVIKLANEAGISIEVL